VCFGFDRNRALHAKVRAREMILFLPGSVELIRSCRRRDSTQSRNPLQDNDRPPKRIILDRKNHFHQPAGHPVVTRRNFSKPVDNATRQFGCALNDLGWWSQAGSNRRPPHCERDGPKLDTSLCQRALTFHLFPGVIMPWRGRGPSAISSRVLIGDEEVGHARRSG